MVTTMTLSKKMGTAISLLFFILMALFAVFYSVSEVNSMKKDTEGRTYLMRQSIDRILQMTDEMLTDKVGISLHFFRQELDLLGSVNVVPADHNGALPNIWFGEQLLTGDSRFVDKVSETSGASATLFVKQGDQFVRVATSIVQDGKRVIGTNLDRGGVVYQKLMRGEAHIGLVDVLGVPTMLAGYEPIRAANGQVVGAIYIGYLANGKMLSDSIINRRVFDSGILALIDDQNRILHHSKHADSKMVQQVVNGQLADWTLEETTYKGWNFRVITAYPNAELNSVVINKVLTVLVITAVCGVLLALVIIGLLRKIVIQPIEQMAVTLEDITEGNLAARLNANGNDEISQMARTFNRMIERLQETMTGIRGVADQLSVSSGQLSEMASATSAAIAEQTSETEQIATAMHEMSATVQEVARSTGIAAENAQDAQRFAGDGKQVVERSIISIEALASDVEQAAAVIHELSVASGNISQVLSVIRAIAEQTNLLALNAAIEAARAGQHGLGFSVVADEVRSLAGRTQQSTAEIQSMIERIQRESARAVEVMERSQQTARNNVNLTRDSGEALQTILEAVEHISDRSTEIASASEEQSAVAEEISSNIVRIRDIAERNHQSARASQTSSDGLADLAASLLAKIKFFRV